MKDLSNLPLVKLFRLYSAKEITESQLLNEVDKRHTEALIGYQKQLATERMIFAIVTIMSFAVITYFYILAT